MCSVVAWSRSQGRNIEIYKGFFCFSCFKDRGTKIGRDQNASDPCYATDYVNLITRGIKKTRKKNLEL